MLKASLNNLGKYLYRYGSAESSEEYTWIILNCSSNKKTNLIKQCYLGTFLFDLEKMDGLIKYWIHLFIAYTCAEEYTFLKK